MTIPQPPASGPGTAQPATAEPATAEPDFAHPGPEVERPIDLTDLPGRDGAGAVPGDRPDRGGAAPSG